MEHEHQLQACTCPSIGPHLHEHDPNSSAKPAHSQEGKHSVRMGPCTGLFDLSEDKGYVEGLQFHGKAITSQEHPSSCPGDLETVNLLI